MIAVTFSPADEKLVRRVGKRRADMATDWEASFDADPAKLRRAHLMGAAGELAFCRAVGLEWPARVSQTLSGDADVDPYWEVRWSKSYRHVKVRPPPESGARFTDEPDALVVHVTGNFPKFEVHGFLWARWAQEHIALTDPGDYGRPAHFAHPLHLSPIDPGFHEVCAWIDRGGWMCLYCGKAYDG